MAQANLYVFKIRGYQGPDYLLQSTESKYFLHYDVFVEARVLSATADNIHRFQWSEGGVAW